MTRTKNLSLPLISVLTAAAALPASAQLTFELSSQKTYRQDIKSTNFRGGAFNINLSDGTVASIAGCNFFQYYPPGYIINSPCSPGTTGFLTSGSIDGATIANPYLLVTGITPALVIEPRQPNLISLIAAPASTLPRPAGGFEDKSASLYFNLHTANVHEYVLTRYTSTRLYSSNERARFESEIVPGVYHYVFPRLNQPTAPAPLTATIYPLPEGFAKLNNQVEGFQFIDVNGNHWTKDGFLELSYFKPNTFKWAALKPGIVIARADSLYFSLRVLKDPTDPNSDTVLTDKYSGKLQSIFPNFANNGDPKVLLGSVFTTSFSTPPLLPAGTRAIAEVELVRNLATSGVAVDRSNRKFQIPVVVVNRYTDYRDFILSNSKNTDILQDSDGDGFDNLNEWILDSNAADAGSTPAEPVATAHDAVYDADFLSFFGRIRLVRAQYFGFTINEKLGTVPSVDYTLQRSTDNGKTWQLFVSDPNWSVTTVSLAPGEGTITANSIGRIEIRVESKITAGLLGDFIQPPGTGSDRYRVRITTAVVAPVLGIKTNIGVAALTWLGPGILQFSPDMVTPFTDVPGASSPYSTPLDAVKKFYRLRY